ncbi:MAG: HNH endonuclease [Leptospirales bacterium]|nr:HNH endonuclease [Leptospirales bacterium]
MDGLLHQSVLVLNAGMAPIEICTVRKAILDIFREIAFAVVDSPHMLRSPSLSVAAPRVISRRHYHRLPRRKPPLNKWTIFQRDDHTCAYCRRRFAAADLTVDHITPRSRWQRLMSDPPPYLYHSWRNVVAACSRCNSIKGSRLLGELGWRLERAPQEPEWMPHLVISRRRAERMGWLEFCAFNVKLVDDSGDSGPAVTD